LIGVRTNKLTVKLWTCGVDAARSRGDDVFAFSQVEVWRRQDLALGQPGDQQEAGKDRRQAHPASGGKRHLSSRVPSRNRSAPSFFSSLSSSLHALTATLPLSLSLSCPSRERL